SDGGLYKTTNVTPQSWIDANNGSPWPTNWSTISGGMNITSFYRLSSSRNSAGRLAAGAQDNATFYYDGTGWKTIFGGDGMDNYLDPINNNFVIGASQYGNFYISDNGGISSNGVNVNVNSENGEWVSPIIADYENPGTLYVGLTNVNKSIDGGYTWEALSPLPSNGIFNNEISSLACAKTNSNILYVTRRIRFEYNSPSSIYKTIDGGNTWTDITLGLPDSLYYTSSIVSSTDENTIYITLAGFEVNQKVYKSSNGGLTWENISFNLPNIPINCIKTIPTSNQLIIATDLGVYIFNELSSTWINVSNGLPNVIVSDIEFNEALDKIYIATFGRGIWENNLSSFIDGLVELENTNASIELFPTLNNGTFTIKLSDEKDIHEKFELEIVNINGQCIYTSLLQGQMLYTQSISIPAGMYFVKLKSSKIKAVKRIIIE
ncbi:MAG: T9SS type A sorting domain-containing protein, partial [Flavobacteriia bacterium]|nr:T9SS type A sorting domain-containing protein [Flavobacteriia bacterium]